MNKVAIRFIVLLALVIIILPGSVFGCREEELTAIIETYKILKTEINNENPITICTDSEYSMKSLTVWIHKWKRNNFKDAKSKPIKNVDLITKIDTLKIIVFYGLICICAIFTVKQVLES